MASRAMSSEAKASDVHALVLAAGQSRRFGADKRLARLADGRTVLQASLANALEAFDRVSVVIREDDDLATLDLPAAVEPIRTPRAARGMGASLADGVMAIRQYPCKAFAILLGDMPWIPVVLMKRLASQAEADRILLPVHGNRTGHPVIFGHAFADALTRLDGDQGARAVLVEHGGRCRRLEVGEPGVLRDVDHPEDVQNVRPA